MRRTEALEAVRMAVFLNLLNRWESAELNQAEAAELLGVSERTFRRWTRRYEEEGEAGLVDRRLGKASGKRVPGRPGGGSGAALSRALSGLHGQAFP
jgi:transposase-like protein